MTKRVLFIILSLVLSFSFFDCNSAQKEKIQNKFLGCTFGDTKNDVEKKLLLKGFNPEFEESGKRFIINDVRFGGHVFESVYFWIVDGVFSCVMFLDCYENEEIARSATENLFEMVDDVYAFKKGKKTHDILIDYIASDGQCSCLVRCMYTYNYYGTQMLYYPMLIYRNDKLNFPKHDEL